MKRWFLPLLGLVVAFVGCNDNELGIDKRRQNQPPETVLASGPPDSTDGAVYKVHLFWSGSDPDGTVEHFDYIMVDHPPIKSTIDGEDPETTVVVTVPEVDDPRWIGTTSTDSIFVTIADTLRRDPQPDGNESENDVRAVPFERWHTFFVRAVDDEGVPDETPDYRTFNSVNIAPTVALQTPIKAGQRFTGPPVIVFNWTGQDPVGDGTVIDPVASRWVIIDSRVTQLNEYTSWPDSLYHLPKRFKWSEWRRWDAIDQSGVRAVVRNLLRVGDTQNSGRYIFAVQAMDEAGAITPVFDKTTSSKNNAVEIKVSGAVGPTLIVEDEFLGTHTFVGGSRPVQLDIAAGQPIRFQWRGDAERYGGDIAAYRFGWNIRNPENDEEWQQNWSATARSAPTRTFSAGSHRFFLQTRDNAETVTRAIFELTVHQVTRLRDLLWVDDTEEINPGSGAERREDDRWTGVLGELAMENNFEFDSVRDVFDVVENRFESPPIQLVFDYKTVIWSVRNGDGGRSGLRSLAQFFDPFVERNRNAAKAFNFLNIYLKNQGRLWINGFKPGFQLWPTERANGQESEPVNVTNWDDPREPHPFIDSVGTTSLLYNMGVEMFDVGAATGHKRFQLNQFCQGFVRSSPQGFSIQTFETNPVLSHSHLLDIPTADVDAAPAQKTYETTEDLDHKHTITLTNEDFVRLQQGHVVMINTSEDDLPEPHSHVTEFVDQLGLWGAPALVTGSTWGQPSGQPGRPNVEIYNMPGAMAVQRPPLIPMDGISIPLYNYVSGKKQDPEAGVFYPLTADQQPVMVLAKGSPVERFYGRAIAGFEPELLDVNSHKRLAEFIMVRHFRLGQLDAD